MGSLLSGLLNSYITDYVYGLTSSISLWQGSLDAKEVVLNTQMLDNLNLPLKMSKGKVGVLRVQIPWTSLGRSPTLVILKNVEIEVCPALDPEEYKRRLELLMKLKKENLDRIEEQRFLRYDEIFNKYKAEGTGTTPTKLDTGQAEVAGSDEKRASASYIMRLVKSIMSNVRVEVDNVVIVYKDRLHGPDTDHTHCEFRLEMRNSSLVSEPKRLGTRVTASLTGASLRFSMAKCEKKAEVGSSAGAVVFGPIGLDFTMEQTVSLEATKVESKATLSPIQIRLHDGVMKYLRSLHQYVKRGRHRPTVKVTDSPDSTRRWWKYAVGQVISEVLPIKQEDSWLKYARMVTRRKRYIEHHQFRLRTGDSALGMEGLSREQTEAILEMESEMTTSQILLYRVMAEAELKNLTAVTFSTAALDPTPSRERAWADYLGSGWLYGKMDFRETLEQETHRRMTKTARQKLYEQVAAKFVYLDKKLGSQPTASTLLITCPTLSLALRAGAPLALTRELFLSIQAGGRGVEIKAKELCLADPVPEDQRAPNELKTETLPILAARSTGNSEFALVLSVTPSQVDLKLEAANMVLNPPSLERLAVRLEILREIASSRERQRKRLAADRERVSTLTYRPPLPPGGFWRSRGGAIELGIYVNKLKMEIRHRSVLFCTAEAKAFQVARVLAGTRGGDALLIRGECRDLSLRDETKLGRIHRSVVIPRSDKLLHPSIAKQALFSVHVPWRGIVHPVAPRRPWGASLVHVQIELPGMKVTYVHRFLQELINHIQFYITPALNTLFNPPATTPLDPPLPPFPSQDQSALSRERKSTILPLPGDGKNLGETSPRSCISQNSDWRNSTESYLGEEGEADFYPWALEVRLESCIVECPLSTNSEKTFLLPANRMIFAAGDEAVHLYVERDQAKPKGYETTYTARLARVCGAEPSIAQASLSYTLAQIQEKVASQKVKDSRAGSSNANHVRFEVGLTDVKASANVRAMHDPGTVTSDWDTDEDEDEFHDFDDEQPVITDSHTVPESTFGIMGLAGAPGAAQEGVSGDPGGDEKVDQKQGEGGTDSKDSDGFRSRFRHSPFFTVFMEDVAIFVSEKSEDFSTSTCRVPVLMPTNGVVAIGYENSKQRVNSNRAQFEMRCNYAEASCAANSKTATGAAEKTRESIQKKLRENGSGDTPVEAGDRAMAVTCWFEEGEFFVDQNDFDMLEFWTFEGLCEYTEAVQWEPYDYPNNLFPWIKIHAVINKISLNLLRSGRGPKWNGSHPLAFRCDSRSRLEGKEDEGEDVRAIVESKLTATRERNQHESSFDAHISRLRTSAGAWGQVSGDVLDVVVLRANDLHNFYSIRLRGPCLKRIPQNAKEASGAPTLQTRRACDGFIELERVVGMDGEATWLSLSSLLVELDWGFLALVGAFFSRPFLVPYNLPPAPSNYPPITFDPEIAEPTTWFRFISLQTPSTTFWSRVDSEIALVVDAGSPLSLTFARSEDLIDREKATKLTQLTLQNLEAYLCPTSLIDETSMPISLPDHSASPAKGPRKFEAIVRIKRGFKLEVGRNRDNISVFVGDDKKLDEKSMRHVGEVANTLPRLTTRFIFELGEVEGNLSMRDVYALRTLHKKTAKMFTTLPSFDFTGEIPLREIFGPTYLDLDPNYSFVPYWPPAQLKGALKAYRWKRAKRIKKTAGITRENVITHTYVVCFSKARIRVRNNLTETYMLAIIAEDLGLFGSARMDREAPEKSGVGNCFRLVEGMLRCGIQIDNYAPLTARWDHMLERVVLNASYRCRYRLKSIPTDPGTGPYPNPKTWKRVSRKRDVEQHLEVSVPRIVNFNVSPDLMQTIGMLTSMYKTDAPTVNQPSEHYTIKNLTGLPLKFIATSPQSPPPSNRGNPGNPGNSGSPKTTIYHESPKISHSSSECFILPTPPGTPGSGCFRLKVTLLLPPLESHREPTSSVTVINHSEHLDGILGLAGTIRPSKGDSGLSRNTSFSHRSSGSSKRPSFSDRGSGGENNPLRSLDLAPIPFVFDVDGSGCERVVSHVHPQFGLVQVVLSVTRHPEASQKDGKHDAKDSKHHHTRSKGGVEVRLCSLVCATNATSIPSEILLSVPVRLPPFLEGQGCNATYQIRRSLEPWGSITVPCHMVTRAGFCVRPANNHGGQGRKYYFSRQIRLSHFANLTCVAHELTTRDTRKQAVERMLQLKSLYIPESDLPPPPGTVQERRAWAIELSNPSSSSELEFEDEGKGNPGDEKVTGIGGEEAEAKNNPSSNSKERTEESDKTTAPKKPTDKSNDTKQDSSNTQESGKGKKSLTRKSRLDRPTGEKDKHEFIIRDLDTGEEINILDQEPSLSIPKRSRSKPRRSRAHLDPKSARKGSHPTPRGSASHKNPSRDSKRSPSPGYIAGVGERSDSARSPSMAERGAVITSLLIDRQADLVITEAKALESKRTVRSRDRQRDLYAIAKVFDRGGKVIAKTQTTVIKDSLQPKWNHKTLLSREVLQNMHKIVFQCYDHDLMAFNELLGEAVLLPSIIEKNLLTNIQHRHTLQDDEKIPNPNTNPKPPTSEEVDNDETLPESPDFENVSTVASATATAQFYLPLKPTKGKKKQSITGTIRIQISLRPQDWASFRRYHSPIYGSFLVPPPAKSQFYTQAPSLPPGHRLEIACTSKVSQERPFCFNAWRQGASLKGGATVAAEIGFSPTMVIRNALVRPMDLRIIVSIPASGLQISSSQRRLGDRHKKTIQLDPMQRCEVFERLVGGKTSKRPKLLVNARLVSSPPLPFASNPIHAIHRSEKTVDSLRLFLDKNKNNSVSVAVERAKSGKRIVPIPTGVKDRLPVGGEDMDPSTFSRVFVVYSPFVLLNRTSLKLLYRAEAPIFEKLMTKERVVPFLPMGTQLDGGGFDPGSSRFDNRLFHSRLESIAGNSPTVKSPRAISPPMSVKEGPTAVTDAAGAGNGNGNGNRNGTLGGQLGVGVIQEESASSYSYSKASALRPDQTLSQSNRDIFSPRYAPDRQACYIARCSHDDAQEDEKKKKDSPKPFGNLAGNSKEKELDENTVSVLDLPKDAMVLSYQNRSVHKVKVTVRRPDSAEKFSREIDLRKGGQPSQVYVPCRAVRVNELQVIRTERSQNLNEVVHKDTPGYLLGIQIKKAPAPFERTCFVTITPRIILINHLLQPLVVRQHLCPHRETMVPSPYPEDSKKGPVLRARKAFQWTDFGRQRVVNIRPEYAGKYKWMWSGAIDINRMGKQHLLVRGKTREGAPCRRIISVTSETWNSNIIVSFEDQHTYTSKANLTYLPSPVSLGMEGGQRYDGSPFRIENSTPFPLLFYQKGVKDAVEMIPPFGRCNYAWDQPTKQSLLTVALGDRTINSFSLEVIAKHKPKIIEIPYRCLRDAGKLLPEESIIPHAVEVLEFEGKSRPPIYAQALPVIARPWANTANVNQQASEEKSGNVTEALHGFPNMSIKSPPSLPWKLGVISLLVRRPLPEDKNPNDSSECERKAEGMSVRIRACLFGRVLSLQQLDGETPKAFEEEEGSEVDGDDPNTYAGLPHGGGKTRTQRLVSDREDQVEEDKESAIRKLREEESCLSEVSPSEIFGDVDQNFVSLSLAGASIIPLEPRKTPLGRMWGIRINLCEKAVEMQKQVFGESCALYGYVPRVDLEFESIQSRTSWLTALRESALECESALEEARAEKMLRFHKGRSSMNANPSSTQPKRTKPPEAPSPTALKKSKKRSLFSFFSKRKTEDIRLPHQSHSVWRANLERYGPNLRWQWARQSIHFFPEVYGSGPTRVLRISAHVPVAGGKDSSMPGPGGAPKPVKSKETISTNRKLGIGSIFVGEGVRHLSISVRIGGLGLSVIDTTTIKPAASKDAKEAADAAAAAGKGGAGSAWHEELCYMYLGGIEIAVGEIDDTAAQHLRLSIKHIQLDNNLAYVDHPVMLVAHHDNEDQKKEQESRRRPDFIISATRSLSTKKLMVLDFCDVTFARFLLHLDEYLLARLLAWSAKCYIGPLQDSIQLLTGKGANVRGASQKGWHMKVVDPLAMPAGALEKILAHRTLSTQIYLAFLSLRKVEMTASMSPASALVSDHPSVLKYQKHALSLPGVDEAPLELNALKVEHYFNDLDHLLRTMVLHYSRQFLFEFYKIVGSMDLLGNPVGLFRALGQGVFDLVADPLEGMQKNPKEFGKGLAKGAASLVTGSIGGVTNTASKITGTFGNAVAQLSFDPVYLRRRQNIGKATGLADGIMRGFAELGLGFVDGVTGIFRSPFEGAVKEGVSGFFKGAGRGLAGIVVKPVAGALGMVSQTTQGFRQSARGAGKLVHRWGRRETKLARVRPPKAFDSKASGVRKGPEKHYWIQVLQAKDLEAYRAATAKRNFLDKFLLGTSTSVSARNFAQPAFRPEREAFVCHYKVSMIQKNFFGKPIKMFKVLVLTDRRLVRLREAQEGVDRVYGTYRSDRAYDIEASIALKDVERVDISVESFHIAVTMRPIKTKSQRRRRRRHPKRVIRVFCGNLQVCKKLFQGFLVQLEAFNTSANNPSKGSHPSKGSNPNSLLSPNSQPTRSRELKRPDSKESQTGPGTKASSEIHGPAGDVDATTDPMIHPPIGKVDEKASPNVPSSKDQDEKASPTPPAVVPSRVSEGKEREREEKKK